MKFQKQMLLAIAAGLVITSVLASRAQTAAVQMSAPKVDISGGKELALEVKLNEPLPPESSVMVRVKPESTSQLIVLGGGRPDNPERTKVTVRAMLPNIVVPGKWILQDVFIALPSTNIWQPIDHNSLSFEVKGNPFPIPSKAEVEVAK